MRTAFFIGAPTWDGVYFYVRMTSDDSIDTIYYVLEELPTLLLLTLYSQQLLVWSLSYHTATNTMDTYRKVVVRGVWAFNIFAYGVQILIWLVYDHTAGTIDPDAWSLTASILHALCFVVLAIALTGYGLGVRRSVQTVPVGLQLRVRQMRAILCVTTACSVAFLLRSAALVAASWAAYVDDDGFDESLTPGDVAGSTLFFLVTELMPLAAVLRYNGSIPGSRRSKSGSGGNTSPYLRKNSLGSTGSWTMRSSRANLSSPGGSSVGSSTPTSSPQSSWRKSGRSGSVARGLALRLGFKPNSSEEDEGVETPLRGGDSMSSTGDGPDTSSLLPKGSNKGYGTASTPAAASDDLGAARAAAAATAES